MRVASWTEAVRDARVCSRRSCREGRLPVGAVVERALQRNEDDDDGGVYPGELEVRG